MKAIALALLLTLVLGGTVSAGGPDVQAPFVACKSVTLTGTGLTPALTYELALIKWVDNLPTQVAAVTAPNGGSASATFSIANAGGVYTAEIRSGGVRVLGSRSPVTYAYSCGN